VTYTHTHTHAQRERICSYSMILKEGIAREEGQQSEGVQEKRRGEGAGECECVYVNRYACKCAYADRYACKCAYADRYACECAYADRYACKYAYADRCACKCAPLAGMHLWPEI
jgi:hypothetical protein